MPAEAPVTRASGRWEAVLLMRGAPFRVGLSFGAAGWSIAVAAGSGWLRGCVVGSPVLAGGGVDDVVDGDVGGLVQGVDDGVGHTVGGDGAGVEGLGDLPVPGVGDLVGPAGVDDSGADHGDLDAVGDADFLAEAVGDAADEELGGAVDAAGIPDADARHRAGGEGVAGLAGDHSGQD